MTLMSTPPSFLQHSAERDVQCSTECAIGHVFLYASLSMVATVPFMYVVRTQYYPKRSQ